MNSKTYIRATKCCVLGSSLLCATVYECSLLRRLPALPTYITFFWESLNMYIPGVVGALPICFAMVAMDIVIGF